MPKEMKVSNCYLSLTVFLCGASVMMLEILGTRIIGPHYGVSLYVWSALIAVTLISLAAGYYFGGWLADVKTKPTILNWLLFIAATIVLAISHISLPIIRFSRGFGLEAGSLLSSFVLFAPPMFFLGAIVPFSLKLSSRNIQKLGLSSGRIYALSTLGSVVGTLMVGFLLIPYMGLKQIFLLIAGLLFLLSGIGQALQRCFSGSLLGLLMIVVCFLSSIFAYSLGQVQESLINEATTSPIAYCSCSIYRAKVCTFHRKAKLIFHAQSLYGELTVMDSGEDRLLLIDGMVHTAIPRNREVVQEKGYALAQNYYLELLPYYYPAGKKALVVGLGGGLICQILANYQIETKAVEIDPKVVDIAREFFGFKGYAIISDGRYYVQNTKNRFDFVILDAYVSDRAPFYLFTREMFTLTSGILTPKGILAINYIGFPQDRLTKSLYRTLKTVFPFVEAYPTEEGDHLQVMFFFASQERLTLHSYPKGQGDTSFFEGRYLSYSEGEGIIITDNYNPVDLWWIENSFAWRKKTEEVLP